MRILLVRPAAETRYMQALYGLAKLEPLPLEYVGAGVSGEHEVRIFDMRLENGFDGLKETLSTFRPNIVGTTAFTCEASTAKRVHACVKELDRGILTVAGGIHATVATDDYLDENIDVVVIGEGVFTFREIVEHFERSQDFKDIPGIALPNGDRLYRTPARPMCGLDELPLPDRSLTAHLRHRFRNDVWSGGKGMAIMRTTQGCPYRCDFCICWKLTGGEYLKRDIELVIKELSSIKEDYVFFIDDEFFIDANRQMRLAQRIKEEGIEKRYLIYTRADSISANPDVVKAWGDVGLSDVFVGVEAITDSELDAMGKKTDVSVNEKAMDILKEDGITCISTLLVRPEYGRKEFKRLLDYVRDRKLESPSFFALTPFPGTDFRERVGDRIAISNYDLCDFSHAILPTELELKDWYREFANLWAYHQEPVPLGHHMEKLAAIPAEEVGQIVANMQSYEAVMKTLYEDH